MVTTIQLELPPPPAAAAAEGEHCILVWLGQPQLVHYVLS